MGVVAPGEKKWSNCPEARFQRCAWSKCVLPHFLNLGIVRDEWSFLRSGRCNHVTNLIGDGIGPTRDNFSVSSENNEISCFSTKLNFQILQIIYFSSLYFLDTGGNLSGVKATRTWRWISSSIWCPVKERMIKTLHSRICFHGVYRDNFTFSIVHNWCELIAAGFTILKRQLSSNMSIRITDWRSPQRNDTSRQEIHIFPTYYHMTRSTNLMQQLWFIIINNSTCFGHLYFHLHEFRLCTAACGVQH